MATKSMKKTTVTAATEEVKVEKEKVEEKKVKKFNKDDTIPCKSVTLGTLIMEGIKSKEIYLWTGYGDIVEVQYQDLMSLVSMRSEYIYNPYFVVEDEDFISQYPALQKFYDEQFSEAELEGIFELDNKSMIATINNLPNGAKETLKKIAGTKVFSGEIDSVSKIKALDECFGTELNLLSNLFD